MLNKILISFGLVVMFIWGISFGQFAATKIYDNGSEAGELLGFNKGFISCYNQLGLHWLGSQNRFLEFTQKYGSIHNTPWNEFTLEEQVSICMYGGSGSKLSLDKIKEFAERYGVR